MKNSLKKTSIREKDEYIEVDVVAEKYKKKLVKVKDTDGRYIKQDGKYVTELVDVFVKSYLVPTTFYKEGITLYAPAIAQNDRIIKTKSTIFDKYSNKFYLVNHSIIELDNILKINQYNPGQVGFSIKSK